MTSPVDVNDRLIAAAEKAEGGAEILRRVANDPVGSSIPTESGPLPSIAEWFAQIGGGIGTVPGRVDGLEQVVAGRYPTKAAFDASKNLGAGARIQEGFDAAGDGGANLFVKDASDGVSPDDGVRAVSVEGGGRWRSLVYMAGTEVKLPAGFPFAPLVKIIRAARGYAAGLDVRDLMPAVTGVTYYVDVLTGSDANAGTSVAPLKSIQVALGKADVSRVKVAPGFYPHGNNWASVFPAGRDFIVERWDGVRPGPVINSTAVDSLTWTVNGTYSNVYQANRTTVCAVMDYSRTRRDGTPYAYQQVSTLALCSTTDGSWYTDGAIVYVNTLENSTPHREIKVFLLVAAAYFQTAKAVLVDGIEFHGGRESFYPSNSSGAGGLLLARNCKFLYAMDATYGNGLRLEGVAQAYLQNCEALHNARDGLNYHALAGNVPNVVEINCRGLHNGQTGAGNNNGSTMHDGGRIVRIGGEYAYNEGPNVADVNGSYSFNAGVRAYDARIGAVDLPNANFYTSDGTMWLLECDPSGSYYDAVQTGTGLVCLCNTPLRRASGLPAFYQQKLGALVA